MFFAFDDMRSSTAMSRLAALIGLDLLTPAELDKFSAHVRTSADALSVLGLPVEGIGILIAVDALPDLFATTLNVTGDLAATAIVAHASAPDT